MLDSTTLMIFSILAPIVPFAVGLLTYRRLEQDRRILVALMGITVIVQLIAMVYNLRGENNLLIYHIYAPLEFILLVSIYRIWLSDWWNAHIFTGLIIGYLGYSLVNSLFIQPYNTFNSHTIFVGAVCYIILSISFFYKILDQMNLGPLEKSPKFWINTAILLYYSGALLLLGLNYQISPESTELIKSVWIIHSYFNILLYLLFAVGLWLTSK